MSCESDKFDFSLKLKREVKIFYDIIYKGHNTCNRSSYALENLYLRPIVKSTFAIITLDRAAFFFTVFLSVRIATQIFIF